MRSYANDGEAVLASGITAGQTTIALTNIGDLNTEATPPTGNIWGVVFREDYHENNGGTGPFQDPDAELVEAYSYAANTLTVRRGQQGTAAVSHQTPGKTYYFRIVWTREDAKRAQTMVDLRDFDADPTGSNTSTSAISNAITEAAGKPIYVAPGTYVVENVSLAAAVSARFRGDDAALATFKLADAEDAPMFSSASGDVVTLLDFEGIELDGNHANQTIHDVALIYANFERFRAHEVRWVNTGKAGWRCYNVSKRATFRRCRFESGAVHTNVANETTQYILAGQTTIETVPPELVLDACELVGSTPAAAGRGTGGIYVAPSVDGALVRVVARHSLFDRLGYNAQGNVAHPFQVENHGDGSRVLNCRFRRNVNGAIRIRKSSDVLVDRNTIDGEASVTGNPNMIDISGNSAIGGVQVDHAMRVTRNYIRNAPTAQYAIAASFDSGGEAHGVDITGNNIAGGKNGILSEYIAKSLRIDENTIADTTDTSSSHDAIRVNSLVAGTLVSIQRAAMKNNQGRIAVNPGGSQVAAHVVARDNVSDNCAQNPLGGCIQVESIESFRHSGNVAPNLPTGAAEMSVSGIASDSLTLSGNTIRLECWEGARQIEVDVESGTSDFLEQIDGGLEGQIGVFHTANDARDVTVNQNGNINVGSNFVLAVTTMSIALQKRGSDWVELYRINP